MEVRRVTYGLFSVFSDLGGLIKIVQVAITVLVTPISRFLYFLVMIKQMYFAGINDHRFFDKTKDDSTPSNRKKYLDKLKIPHDLKDTEFEN